LVCSQVKAFAKEIKVDRIYQGDSVKEVELGHVIDQIQSPAVVIVSEIHNLQQHHKKQNQFLNALGEKQGHRISVGMEFLSFIHQTWVDQFLFENLAEAEFLKQVEWSGDFAAYRSLVLFPKEHGGETVALNAPKYLTTKIAKSGLASLNDEERTLIPINFSLGNPEYFERFKSVMTGGGHTLPAAVVARYFEAQSVWDETMADNAAKYLERNPDSILVIIVGDFHAQYGGGLPDRLRARGVANVMTISQVNLQGLNSRESLLEVGPHPRYGRRADYIWTSRE